MKPSLEERELRRQIKLYDEEKLGIRRAREPAPNQAEVDRCRAAAKKARAARKEQRRRRK